MGDVVQPEYTRWKNMEKPTLKPLSVAELLDRALQLYKRHALLLIQVSAVVLIPYTIISSVLLLYFDDTRLRSSIFNVFVFPFIELAMIAAISSLYLGKGITVRNSFSIGVKRYWTRIGVNLLIGSAMIPAIFLFILLSFVGINLLGLIVFIPIVAYLSTRWSLAAPILILETGEAVESMKRSWALTEGCFWHVFGTSFTAGLLAQLLSVLPSIFINYLLEQIQAVPPKLILIVPIVVEQLAAVIAYPLIIGVTVSIYYDLRIRKEGFDLMFMADAQSEL